MLSYERHLVVVIAVLLVILGVSIAAIVFDVPLPFIGKD